MGQWKLWFVLLLQLTVSVDRKETGQRLVKTIGREPDVTPICTNATEHVIILIVCWIRTERSREECRLLYRHGEDFVHECDSRFTLLEKNQTVFLHVTSLKPADSGNYTCQCSHADGTDTLRMNITVEEDEDISSPTQIPLHHAVIIGVPVSVFVIITGVIMGFICRKYKHRGRSEPLSTVVQEPEEIEPYSSYLQRENDIYSLVTLPNSVCPLNMTQI
ncbi:uncharacterized protein LOC126402002 isoform X1 [Epinephelus moara]|uniref:uncharacterized protein LOC126402002 isoform X1 n=1 Tax=Epinephelus moara TaxID=300413 RepID=UPI00214E760E|nr:uncharacterized protein LOC126402002 isoform X1 [Epinephelus moara]